MANAVVNVVERRAIVNLVGPGAALAMDAASEAKAAAAQADATRDSVLISAAAKGAFPDTATGIAGTVSGDYFYAASGVAPDKTVGLYLNDAGLAVKQSDLATSGDITSLDTRVTTAETDITARPTSAQLAAPEGAAGIGYANSDVKDKLAENRSLLDYWLAIDIDYTNAISRAEVAGIRALFIPDGVFDVDNIALTDFHIYGRGTLRKRAGTKGAMLSLTGDNLIEGVTLDGNWSNQLQTLPYSNNHTVQQIKGSLTVKGVRFRRSFASAIRIDGASLTTDADCRFVEGATHDNDVDNPRISHYIACYADAETSNQVISINGGVFIGPSLATEDLHLNPTGIFVTSSGLDGVRFRTVNVIGAVLLGCTTNAGNGNVTGAIDTYNGAENINVLGCTIRYFTYAGIKIQNSSNINVIGNIVTEGAKPTAANTNASYGIITASGIRSSVVQQYHSNIANNVIKGCRRQGILNSVDYAKITNNTIDGVQNATLGDAILNTGKHVLIDGNSGRNLEGNGIDARGGDYTTIVNNDMEMGVGGVAPTDVGVLLSGIGIKVKDNTFTAIVKTTTTTPCIRTDGPLSQFEISDNTIKNYGTGVDLRTTIGAVDNGFVGIQFFNNITTGFNIAAGCTNISRAFKNLQPVIATSIDAASLAPGAATAVIVTTLPGVVTNRHRVEVTPLFPTSGLDCVAWVSGSNNVAWFVRNPSGNPYGTIDLASGSFMLMATEINPV